MADRFDTDVRVAHGPPFADCTSRRGGGPSEGITARQQRHIADEKASNISPFLLVTNDIETGPREFFGWSGFPPTGSERILQVS